MKTEPPLIGQYALQQRLKREGVSEVWRAYDTEARRIVLVKLFRTDLSDTSPYLADYMRNVERVARLHHPNIVPIYDAHVRPSQSPDGLTSLICLVMKYVEGPNLADYIRSTSAAGKLPPASEVVAIITGLAQALDVAHRSGVVHGNLKPGNILLERGSDMPGKPQLTDFGPTQFLAGRNNNDIPFYLSPEQIKGAHADERSDVYALGVILYELYTGVLPFQGKRPISVMMQHVNASPTPPDLVNPMIPAALTQIILRCLAKNPQERFVNPASVAVALADALHMATTDDLRRSALPYDSMPATAAPSRTPPLASPTQPARKKRPFAISAFIALLLLLSFGLGAILLFAQRGNTVSTRIIGHAFFLNSGQLDGSFNQGINDELQIDLSNVPEPASGKSYYAWLLGDSGLTEETPLALGRLTVTHGAVHFLYPGQGHHANLLSFASRFLITEDDARNPVNDPLLNQSIWRYYAVLPQTPDPADKLHFSMLDHLRHLLVESPELSARGLHGGLAFWFSKNTATISNLANTLVNEWQNKEASSLRGQLIRILDYLDGSASVVADVPPHTPLLADAHEVQIALFGPAPQDSDPPGYVYQNEVPPGYIYLIDAHLNGAVLSPAASAEQHQLALNITKSVDEVKSQFTQIYQEAKQLVSLPEAQLLNTSALTILNTLAKQAQYAYTGHPDPATGLSQGGTLWIYTNLQRLAAFDIASYTG